MSTAVYWLYYLHIKCQPRGVAPAASQPLTCNGWNQNGHLWSLPLPESLDTNHSVIHFSFHPPQLGSSRGAHPRRHKFCPFGIGTPPTWETKLSDFEVTEHQTTIEALRSRRVMLKVESCPVGMLSLRFWHERARSVCVRVFIPEKNDSENKKTFVHDQKTHTWQTGNPAAEENSHLVTFPHTTRR